MGLIDRIARCNAATLARFAEHSVSVASGESTGAIYNEAFKLAEVYEGQVETNAPAATIDSDQLLRLGIAHGSRLTILKGTIPVGDFEVIGIEPDGLGLTRLVLTKDP